MTKIETYNGWPNKMTWAVYTELGSDYEGAFTKLEQLAQTQGQDAVKSQVLSWVDQWFEGRRVPEGVTIFMQSILNCAIDFTWWWKITDTLQGESELEIDNPFTQVLYDAVKELNWQAFVEDPPEPEEDAPIEEHMSYAFSGFDERLKEYCRSLLLTWADSRTRKQPTAARHLARRIVSVYLDQIAWERVYIKYKGA